MTQFQTIAGQGSNDKTLPWLVALAAFVGRIYAGHLFTFSRSYPVMSFDRQTANTLYTRKHWGISGLDNFGTRIVPYKLSLIHY